MGCVPERQLIQINSTDRSCVTIIALPSIGAAMKRIAVFAVAALLAGEALAQGYGPGYGMGPGMMGGYSMGPGMIGRGTMGGVGPGMMGFGMMGGYGHDLDLTLEQEGKVSDIQQQLAQQH